MPAAVAIPLITTAVGVGGSLASAAIGSGAAKTAAGQQVSSAQQALDFQKQIWGQQQQNMAPFLQAGTQSIGQLMQGLQSGQFGPGSLPELPAAFTAPSLQQARETPGYQFTQQQGIDAISRSASARGALGSGSTFKALQSFGSGLADSTYNDVFNRAMAGYNSQLQRAQVGAQFQQQGFNQLLSPAVLGVGATESLNQLGQGVASNVGNLMTQQGNAQAAGTVGSANAWGAGLQGLTSNLMGGILGTQVPGWLGVPGVGGARTPPFVPQGPTLPPGMPGGGYSPTMPALGSVPGIELNPSAWGIPDLGYTKPPG